MRPRLLGLILAILPTACALDRLELIPAGTWGGNHVSLEATDSGAMLEFDCAHGAITTVPLVDEEGRFSLPGLYVREPGGPVRIGEAEDSHPALYTGLLEGTRLTFSVRLTDGDLVIGPFTAVLGTEPGLFKCL